MEAINNLVLTFDLEKGCHADQGQTSIRQFQALITLFKYEPNTFPDMKRYSCYYSHACNL